MESQDVLRFINERPYVYSGIGHGVKMVLKMELLSLKPERVKICIKRGRGGLDVFHPDGVFHFEWDDHSKKWAFPSP